MSAPRRSALAALVCLAACASEPSRLEVTIAGAGGKASSSQGGAAGASVHQGAQSGSAGAATGQPGGAAGVHQGAQGGSAQGGSAQGGEAQGGQTGQAQAGQTGQAQAGEAQASKLTLDGPSSLSGPEESALSATFVVSGGSGVVRVRARSLPPGAVFDEPTRTLSFRPDFTQGGVTTKARIEARDSAGQEASLDLSITIDDSITPPDPTVVSESDEGSFRKLTLRQVTDSFLDAGSKAGRSFDAVLTVPESASSAAQKPLRVSFHGFGASASIAGSTRELRLAAHDPDDTYWWGYAEHTAPASGVVAPYTLRRVLHLVDWVKRTNPGVDLGRIYASGSSMGGAGALYFGLLHARHVAWVDSRVGQPIARNHRKARVAQLTPLWGAPDAALVDDTGMAVWSRLDMTRALRDEPLARDQALSLKHGKDDGTIHFGAVLFASPDTGASFYQALQQQHVAHMAVFDEGGHGTPDPVLGDGWWSNDFHPLFDDTTFYRLDRSHPAFSACSLDDDPGNGEGNGKRPFDEATGYAGDDAVAGDTGWAGDIAGAINRFVRFDAQAIVDDDDVWQAPLRLASGSGGPPPKPGYPTTGDLLPSPPPATVSVTPRRLQRFSCLPGEALAYTFGDQKGMATCAADGSLTVSDLSLTDAWKTLRIARE